MKRSWWMLIVVMTTSLDNGVASAAEPPPPAHRVVATAPSQPAGGSTSRLQAVRSPLAPVRLQMVSALDMVVSADRVFLTSLYDEEVVVLDHGGQILHRLPVSTPVGLLLVNGDLYVASRSSSTIVRFDLGVDPPEQVAAYQTGSTTHPEFLAFAGGRIWYSANCTYYDSDFGSMDPDGSDPTTFTPVQVASGCPQVWAGVFAADSLVVGFDQVYDASTDPPTLISQGAASTGAWGFMPDGGHVITGVHGAVQEHAIDDLSTVTRGWQARGSRSIAVSPAADGSFAAGGRMNTPSSSVQVFHDAMSTPFASYRFNGDLRFGEGADIEPRMVAYSPDGSTLFTLASYRQEGIPSYLYIVDPTLEGTDLVIDDAPSKITAGTKVVIRGTTTGIDPGETVGLYLRGDRNRTYRLDTALVQPDGGVRVVATPTTSGALFLGYRGSASAAPSESAQSRMRVVARLTARMVGGYRTGGGYRYFHERQDVVYLVRTKPNLAGERITIRLEFDRGTGWRSGGSKRFRVREDGTVAIGWSAGSLPRYRYRLEASSEGSSDLLAGTSGWTYFAVTA